MESYKVIFIQMENDKLILEMLLIDTDIKINEVEDIKKNGR